MPGPKVHEFIDRLFFGKSYRKIHREMDKPFKILGRRHRELFHDATWAYIVASKLYPGDPNAVLAAQCHIIYDEICSRNPQFRMYLEMLARSNSRMKRRRKRKRALKRIKM